MNPPTRAELLLSLQRALLGEVSPALRGVSPRLGGEGLEIWFYLDGPVSGEDRESASCVTSEVAADFPVLSRVEERVERVDAPARLPPETLWAYRRRESSAG
jgi:hypothetical protein